MSVFFLYPLFLFGLAAASLPVLIHLLNRRRLKRIKFPAVRFILLSQKRISRSYRLRHWLLLALRTLAVLCLALLLANPIFQTGAGLFAGGGPVALVVVLDNSLSMTWSGDGNGLKQAKDAARLLISSLNDGARAALIPTSIDGKEAFRLKGEKAVLLKELDGIEIADGTANLAGALGKAYELLNEPVGQKEIRFITDMGLTGWEQFSVATLKQVDPSIPLKLIRVGRKQQPLNGSVKDVRLGGQGVGVNLPIQIEATLANFGDSEIKDLLVQLSIDGQNKEKKLATVPPKGETTVSFQTRINQPGAHNGKVMLKQDGLAGNALANLALEAQDKLRVLVVDGDPQTSLVQSESFFLIRALNPAGERDSSLFLPTVILGDGLNAANLESFQVVMLCNVATLPDSFVAKLQNYLRQGGGLLIFAGDKFQPDSYNQKLGQTLPGTLRDKKTGPEASGEKIDKIDLAHLALPASLVGKSLRVTKPNKQNADVAVEAEKDRASATVEGNEQAGIYRLTLPSGADKDSAVPQLYAVNPPFLESRLDEINANELAAKLKPIRAEVISVDALKEGGKRVDLALPLLALLIVTLLLEGWLGQRF